MGHKLKRVPLDFDWPVGEHWGGYQNPHYAPCPAEKTGQCQGGCTAASRWLDAVARFLQLLGSDAAAEGPRAEAMRARGVLWPHPYLASFPGAPDASGSSALMPPGGAEMVAFVHGLSGLEPGSTAGVSSYAIRKTLVRAAGLDPVEGWGVCKVCAGQGIDPAVIEAYEAWKPTDPPTGEGWQLWENVSEGSPISPVFATADELIDWMSQPDPEGRSTPWGQGFSRAGAEAFVFGGGYAPSFVVGGGAVMSGVDFLGETEGER